MATVFCKKCGESIEIPEGSRSPFITCPKCRSAVQVTTQAARPASPAGSPPARPPVSSAPRPAPSAPPPSSVPPRAAGAMPSSGGAPGETLPELMKANKKVAGQPCAICARPVALGEQIHNCPSCHSINHDACWKQSGGCTSLSCSAAAKSQRPAPPGLSGGMGGMSGMDDMSGAMASPGPGPSQGSVPCRWCKEPIMRGARKCKHCNEFQRDEDRETQKPNAWVEDEPLSTTDWIGVLCCPLIGFLQGLVYAAQGNPKAKRLMLYSAISMVIGAMLRGAGGGR